jgi:Methyltransferase FkbM domain
MLPLLKEDERPLLTGLKVPGTLSDNTNNNNKVRSLTDEKNKGDEVDNGWHAIHVFYGEKAGLGADPQQLSYSQSHQDEIILDLLGPVGFFIDLAANDALEFSNTLALERHAGWHGLCIEPNPVYWYGLAHRKCTVVGALMGGKDVQQVNAKFRGVYGGIVGKIDRKLANRKKEPKAPTERRYTVPLTQVLEKYQVPKVIDYMSLDIEGAEFLVMQHFPFDTYQIKVLTVERPDQQLHDLFVKHGYLHLKDLTWWGETLWAHQSTGFTTEHPKIQKIIFQGK